MFKTASPDALTQPQREAFVDLLIWMMFVDNKIDALEHEQLDAEVEELYWEAVTPLSQYLKVSVARLRSKLDHPPEAEDYLLDISRRLGTVEARQLAYHACERVAGSDNDYARVEDLFLARIQSAFSLS
jgi:hypothetical protein